jgi:hypothetical protein
MVAERYRDSDTSRGQNDTSQGHEDTSQRHEAVTMPGHAALTREQSRPYSVN